MSTRSICHIHSEWEEDENKPQLVMSYYRHWDGYPSGHGQDLVDMLKDKNIVNGIGSDFREGIDFNGMGCLAVWLAYNMEGSVRSIATGSDDMWEEYMYDIYWDGEQFLIQVTDTGLDERTEKIPLKDWDAEEVESHFNKLYEER